MNSTYQKLPDGSWNYALSPYFEEPHLYLAPIAAATFCLLSAFHLYLGIRYRTTYMIPLILGCLGELVGYCYRYLSIQLPFDITRFAVQYIAIIVAPILITTSLYTLLEKVMHASHPSVTPFRHSAKVFVGVEVVTLLVQVGGAQMASDQYATKETRDLGVSVLIGGISLQLVSFFCYLGMAGWFYKRAVQLETQYVLPLNSNWKRLFKTLIVSSFAVLARSVFRLIEFVSGITSPLARNELYMYGFDFFLMAFAVLCFIFVHPGFLLQEQFEKDAVFGY